MQILITSTAKRNVLFSILCAFLSTGCSAVSKADARNAEILKAQKAGNWPPKNVIKVYKLGSGIQYYEGINVTDETLMKIANSVQCQDDNPFTYRIKGRISEDGEYIEVVTNKSSCTFDPVLVKNIVKTGEEKEVARRNAEFEADKQRRKAEAEAALLNPINVYIEGCQAYRNSIRGEKYLTHMEAVKKYSKINIQYVLGMYSQGWDNARYYGYSVEPCMELARTFGVVGRH